MSIEKNKQHIRKLKYEQNSQKQKFGMNKTHMQRSSNSLVPKKIPT